MLFVLPWVCFFGAAAALAVLINDYRKEEEMFKDDRPDQETVYSISA